MDLVDRTTKSVYNIELDQTTKNIKPELWKK
jgi:hypothetical protein